MGVDTDQGVRLPRPQSDAGTGTNAALVALFMATVRDYAILTLDVNGYVATWNIGAERLKGYRADEIIGKHFSIFYPAEDIAANKPDRLLSMAVTEGRTEDEGWRIRKDGRQFWANVVITALRDSDGILRGFGKITRDLTERRNHERQLEQLANHDPLTGVLNRRSFARELSSHATRVARYGNSGSVIMIDLDNFKLFNDTQGHSGGDRLIVRVAHGLQSRLRESDVLARIGGDEFAILLPAGDSSAALATADALLAVVREADQRPVVHGDKRITASVGIASFDDADGLTPEAVMANADLAMYEAKRMGRNRWVRYKPAPHARPKLETLSQWAERIDQALRDDGLALLARPIISLQPADHTVYELMLRMHDVVGAAKEQATLVKSAERTGRIREIDRWVAWRAIEILAEQRDRGNDICVAINVSDQTIGDDTFVDLLEERFGAQGVPPERLMIAVSEAAVIAEISHAVRFAARAAKLGCAIALDDFGAGSGSLYHIKQLCFDYLTIDDEFVQHCVASEADRIVISTIVKLAGCMGKGAIAKGIPDAATLDVLTTLGVAYGQGAHIGRPVPLDALLPSGSARI